VRPSNPDFYYVAPGILENVQKNNLLAQVSDKAKLLKSPSEFKITIVIDMLGTLAVNAKLRPYAKEFIETLSRNFELILWADGIKKEIEPMIT